MAGSTRRDEWVDALRALALLGVFLINALGQPFAPSYAMQSGAPTPIDSTLSIVIHGLLVAFVQSKAWPLLSLLFGYSLCTLALQSRARGINPTAKLRRRYIKLLLVGVIHGAWIFFGDILTVYAIVGWLAAPMALARPARLIKHWRWAMGLVCLLEVLFAFASWDAYFNPYPLDGATFSSVSTWSGYFSLNAQTYGSALLSNWTFLIKLYLLVLSGILAKRFNLFSRHAFARRFWQRHLGNGHLIGALSVNLALGIAAMQIHTQAGLSSQIAAVAALSGGTGMWLMAAGVGWVMRENAAQSQTPAWVQWLAPAGRHTLAMYLASSVALMLTSGAGFKLLGSTPVRLAVVLVAWSLAIYLARLASAHHWRGPITRWLGR